MAEIVTTSPQAEPEYPTERQESQKDITRWQRLALGAILLISVVMNFYKLGQAGFTSYYPAAVRSMLDSWHNFFFAAYDPGGFSALDKPPVGFWLQVISAKTFGFTPLGVLLPQATCGVLAVLMLYFLVRRQFGVTAGLLAALVLALSPISIITNRTVQVDSTLTLVLLLGTRAILQARETGRLRWLLLCAAIIGIGFNIKMMEAYLVVPAFGLLYLLTAPLKIWRRLWHLALALLLLVVISFSWALAVDLIPASQRPHVGSTQDNSEIGLSLGYNGIQRLLGTSGATGVNPNAQSSDSQAVITTPSVEATPSNPEQLPANAESPQTNARPPDATPLFRLFTGSLAGQIGWLLPLAIFGACALVRFRRSRSQNTRMLQALLLWGTWLLTMGIFFSVAAFFHEYYLTVMAPAIAALCGIGLTTMWQDYRGSGWRSWWLPLAIFATAAEQVSILSGYPEWGQWMIPLLIVLCVVAGTALIIARFPLRFTSKVLWSRLLLPTLASGLIILLLGPIVWATLPIFQGTEGMEPIAGPAGQIRFGQGPAKIDPVLIRYLEANQGHTQILVAVAGVDTDSLILATNKTVMPLDGFSYYPLTTTELSSLIARGKLRFLLLHQIQAPPTNPLQETNGTDSNIHGGNGASAPPELGNVIAWTIQHCQAVPASQWQASASSSGSGDMPQLYDCSIIH